MYKTEFEETGCEIATMVRVQKRAVVLAVFKLRAVLQQR
jgi:hypothetical protein